MSKGLNAAEKRQQLGRDCAKYHLDLTCLQETKVAASDDLELASGHKLVLIQQRTAKYRGLGFVIAPRLKPFVRQWYVSDRVAVLDLAIPYRDGTFCQCRVVNAYGPTSQRVRENPSVSEQFYAELNSAIKAPARFLVFVCGDFNSKLGKRTAAELMAWGPVTKMVKHWPTFWQYMFFCLQHSLHHASRHKTMWTGWFKDRTHC